MSALEINSVVFASGVETEADISGDKDAPQVRHWQTSFEGPVEKHGNVLTVVKKEIPGEKRVVDVQASVTDASAGAASTEGVEKHGNVLTAPKPKPTVWNVSARGFVPGQYPSGKNAAGIGGAAIEKVGNVLAVPKSVVGSPPTGTKMMSKGASGGDGSAKFRGLAVEKHGGVLAVSRDQLNNVLKRRSSDSFGAGKGGNKVVVRKHGNVLAVTRDKPPKVRGSGNKGSSRGSVRYRGSRNAQLSRKPGEVVLVGRRTASEASSAADGKGQSWNSPALLGGDVKSTTNFYRSNIGRNVDKFKNRTVILVGGPTTGTRVPGEKRLQFISPEDGQVSAVTQGLYDSRERRPLAFQLSDAEGGADWANLPVTFMNLLVKRVGNPTVRMLRSVCQEWRDRIDTSHTELELDPRQEIDAANLRAKFPFLKKLKMQKRDLSDPSFLGNLFPLQCLVSLDLAGCTGLDAFQLIAVTEPLKTSLATLDLSGVDEVNDLGLGAVVQLANLKRLYLGRQSNITDEGMEGICEGLHGLEYLDVSFCSQLTDESIKQMGRDLGNLTELDVSGNSGLTLSTLESFTNDTALLSTLRLYDCSGVTPEGMKSAARIKSLKSIGVTPGPVLDVFAEERVAKGLEGIIVRGASTVTLGEVVRSLKPLTAVGSFVFEGGLVKSECMGELSKWGALKGFSALKLDPARASVVAQDVSFLAECDSLRSLSLPRCDGVGLEFLSKLSRSVPDLEELAVSACVNVKNDSLLQVANLEKLVKLDVSDCRELNDEGIGHLKRLPLLRELNMANLPVTKFSLISISRCPKLELVDISNCTAILPEGVSKIAEANSSLTRLIAKGCEQISKAEGNFLDRLYATAGNISFVLEI
ncbi:hypothetical protein BSKO_07304 [Bryopsis sp. KO-2023]|nr:hypothetical protein BSKO_07304 [Bryopsis sp. KO-2023]